jgi:putative hydrolase of the HAD superfamily
MPALKVIGLDADDTLWQNEQFFRLTHDRFAALLADYAPADRLEERLLAAEQRNLGQYGFGIKGFTLSMIETAIEVTQDRVPARIIRDLIEAGQEMLRHPIELLPGVEETLSALSQSHRLVLITKGDLLDQERKLAQSGLGELFSGVEIVSHKTSTSYEGIFRRHGAEDGCAMMVGNSMRSDVIPAIAAGAWGVHVPHDLTWIWEHDDAPVQQPRFRVLPELAALPPLVAEIEQP